MQIPNCNMGIRRSTSTRGAFGDRVVSRTSGTVQGYPASKREQSDGTWRINLDPALWPVRVDDTIVDADTGTQFIVRTAQNIGHPEAPEIGHVRVTAVEVAAAGVEPGTPLDVGR